MSEPKTVKLGQYEYPLTMPSSFAVRHEIVASGGSNAQRAFAAALGACCPRLDKQLEVSLERSGFVPLKYGGAVIDALAEKGVPMADIVEAGGIAYGLIVSSFISEDEVASAEGFTAPKPEGSTSSSS